MIPGLSITMVGRIIRSRIIFITETAFSRFIHTAILWVRLICICRVIDNIPEGLICIVLDLVLNVFLRLFLGILCILVRVIMLGIIVWTVIIPILPLPLCLSVMVYTIGTDKGKSQINDKERP